MICILLLGLWAKLLPQVYGIIPLQNKTKQNDYFYCILWTVVSIFVEYEFSRPSLLIPSINRRDLVDQGAINNTTFIHTIIGNDFTSLLKSLAKSLKSDEHELYWNHNTKNSSMFFSCLDYIFIMSFETVIQKTWQWPKRLFYSWYDICLWTINSVYIFHLILRIHSVRPYIIILFCFYSCKIGMFPWNEQLNEIPLNKGKRA